MYVKLSYLNVPRLKVVTLYRDLYIKGVKISHTFFNLKLNICQTWVFKHLFNSLCYY